MTRRLVAIVAGLAVLAVGALLLDTAGEPEGPVLRQKALPAEALVDSIGVNTHLGFTDTAYARQADVLARLRELGVRHIRDAMPNPVAALRSGLSAAKGQGIGATLISDPALDPGPGVADAVAVAGGGIDAFEGPNELDNGRDLAWPATLTRYMPALAAAARKQAPGVPLIGPSFINSASRTRIGADLPGLYNAHPYPGGGPPEPALGEGLRDLRRRALARGVVFSEMGYHNGLAATTGQPPASEDAAAVYLPRVLVSAFGAGVRRTFIYELVDEKPDPGLVDAEQHFGLLRNDLSPKPAFRAIQALIAALRTSPGRSVRARPPWDLRVRGAGEVKRLTLTRRDGSLVIALWRPVSVWDQGARRPLGVAPLPVELSFGLGARDIAVWRPSVSSTPVLTRPYARRLGLELEGDLVLVSLR